MSADPLGVESSLVLSPPWCRRFKYNDNLSILYLSYIFIDLIGGVPKDIYRREDQEGMDIMTKEIYSQHSV